MNILPVSLSSRLALYYAVTFCFFLVIAFGLALVLVNSNMNSEINDDLSEDIHEYKKIYRSGGLEQVIEEIKRDVKASDTDDEFVQLLDSQGNSIYLSSPEKWNNLDINDSIISGITGKEQEKVYFETQDIAKREFDTRIAYSLIGPGIIMQIGESLEQTAEILELLVSLFLVSLVVVIPLASIAGWLIVRRSVGGIEYVSRTATELSNGKLDSRVNLSGQSSEIQNLIDTFNSMADRIKVLITEMREMIDNIAHDLRTPLGRIRMISEMTLSNVKDEECKTAASNTLEQCDKLLQYINSTLDVAEVEAGISTNKNEQVNLSAVAGVACELFETIAEEKNIQFIVRLKPDCLVFGNRQNLQRMIANILDNALKYTANNGIVEINIEKNNDYIILKIKDSGIGISDSEQERVFDRFYRSDQSRGEEGCGLGLSFARAVARAHNGDITLTSIPGSGSEFTVSIPSIK